MARREFKGAAIPTRLTGSIGAGDTSFNINANAGWPTGGANGPFTIILDPNIQGKEEVCLVNNQSGGALTGITRGYGDTAATTHAVGVDGSVIHGTSKVDYDEANRHINVTTDDDHTQYLNLTRHAAVVHTAGMLGTDSVGSAQIQANAVGASELANAAVDAAAIAASAFGLVGNISTIDPDDAAAAGATGLIADAGHQHAFTSAAPATLTKTATNTEGAASSHARSDHGHSTANLPWGVVAQQHLTADSSVFSATGNSDFVLSNVSMDATRLYAVFFHANWVTGGVGTYTLHLTEDGTQIGQYDITDSNRDVCNNVTLIFPTTASHTYRVSLVEVVADTIQFLASSTNPRDFWIVDIGPR